MTCRQLASLSVLLVTVAAASAQVAFTRTAQVPAMRLPAAAFDPLRRVVVLHGGPDGETWEYDGQRWHRRATGAVVPGLFGHGLAFDPVTRRVLLFGGIVGNGNSGETWAWDGATWARLSPSTSPAPRHYVRMVTDYARSRVLLYGGYDMLSHTYGDTWEWDGADWRPRAVVGPGPRLSHALAYDPLRRVVVLFGGSPADPALPLADTWEWDGTTWQQRATAAAPSPRGGAALGFDAVAGGLVLFGGRGRYDDYADTWRYDGQTWTALPAAEAPLAREQATCTLDPATLRPLLYGGGHSTLATGDSWLWTGATWRPAAGGVPPARTGAALAWDGSRLLLVGGRFLTYYETLADAWAWDGQWQRLPVAPPELYRHRGDTRVHAVWQPHRQRMLVVVPQRSSSATWEWDGQSWTDHGSAGPFGFDYPMAYDAARRCVVLVTSIVGVSSTWEWDGTWNWRGAGPPGTWGQAMAFDAGRGRCVLFGGYEYTAGPLAGTWEWDGRAWTEITASGPTARTGAGMVWDEDRRRLVLIGGCAGATHFAEAWELVDSTWQRRLADAGWPGAMELAATYHPARRETLVLGSLADASALWEYGPVDPAAFAPYGAGCSPGPSDLRARGGALPWVGDAFALELTGLRPGTPVAIALGSSRDRYAGLPLPLDLTPIGMTGCSLLASPDLPLPATADAGGIAAVSVTVPPLPGAHFFAQGFAVWSGANPLGVVVSHAGAGVVGAR